MVVVALVVKLTSRGRCSTDRSAMGMDGRVFHILKFRTMRVDAEQAGARMATRRTTRGARRWGRSSAARRSTSCRSCSTCCAGDMSLVGPRPERPVFIEEFKRQIPKYHLRHKVKAGHHRLGADERAARGRRRSRSGSSTTSTTSRTGRCCST